MRHISTQEANVYLARLGMRIGGWNQIADIADANVSSGYWVNYQAPKSAHELLSFAQHVAGWLPKGEWKIVQIDNSTSLDAVQENFLGRMLFGPEYAGQLSDRGTFLFEFGKSQNDDRKTELLISDLIFMFLLYEGHMYVISSNSNDGERLGIQDGVAYFSSRDMDIKGAHALLENFDREPRMSPEWIVEILADG